MCQQRHTFKVQNTRTIIPSFFFYQQIQQLTVCSSGVVSKVIIQAPGACDFVHKPEMSALREREEKKKNIASPTVAVRSYGNADAGEWLVL